MNPHLFQKSINPREIKSTKFSLMFRRSDQKVYNPRSVNKDFEDRHIEMFKIVPPCIGSFITMECVMRIDAIDYTKSGVILFWVSEVER